MSDDEKDKKPKPLSSWEQKRQARIAAVRAEDSESVDSAPQITPPVRRDEGGRWLKGSTPNPGGRPKGLAERIRQRTAEGERLLDELFQILDDKVAKPSERLRAIEILFDRGYGKALETSVVANLSSAPSNPELDALSTDTLLALARRLQSPEPLPKLERVEPLEALPEASDPKTPEGDS